MTVQREIGSAPPLLNLPLEFDQYLRPNISPRPRFRPGFSTDCTNRK